MTVLTTPSAIRSEVKSVTMLRGLASTMVFGFHLFNLSSGYLGTESLWKLTYYGKFGVQFFFVISGFVINYSMLNAHYKLKDFPRFLMKRIIRIEPPYLIVVAMNLIFLLIRLKSGLARGAPYIPTWDQVLLHLGYLIPFSHYTWFSIVFWTLAIEFQFYLLFSLLFTPFVSTRLFRWLATAAFVALFFLSHSESHFFYWSPVFLLGINLALFKKEKIGQYELWSFAIMFLAIIFFKLGLVIFVFALLPFLTILFEPELRITILQFLGKISYSLYLLHTLIAFFIINLGIRFANQFYQRIIFGILAVGLTIWGSWLLYRFVERPCQKWASSIKYKSR